MCFLRIGTENGSKAYHGKDIGKMSEGVVQEKSSSLNLRVGSLLPKLADFEWNLNEHIPGETV